MKNINWLEKISMSTCRLSRRRVGILWFPPGGANQELVWQGSQKDLLSISEGAGMLLYTQTLPAIYGGKTATDQVAACLNAGKNLRLESRDLLRDGIWEVEYYTVPK